MLTEARSDEWVQERVDALPELLRGALREGPVPQPKCRICIELIPVEKAAEMFGDVVLDPESELMVAAVKELLDYHAIAAKPERSRREAEREAGPESWRRCVQIYRAAGWAGEAEPCMPEADRIEAAVDYERKIGAS